MPLLKNMIRCSSFLGGSACNVGTSCKPYDKTSEIIGAVHKLRWCIFEIFTPLIFLIVSIVYIHLFPTCLKGGDPWANMIYECLLEFFEMKTILGYDMVTMYNLSISSEVNCALNHYITERRLVVLPWQGLDLQLIPGAPKGAEIMDMAHLAARNVI